MPYLQPIDPTLAAGIQAELATKKPREQKLAIAGGMVVEWLANHGKFVQVPTTGDRFYLWKGKHRLFQMDQREWRSWLHLVTMVNPASRTFQYLDADCQTAAYDGDKAEIYRLAYWDGAILHVSNFNGRVWVLDGKTISQESNGDSSIIFGDMQGWADYTPDFSSDGSTLDWWLNLPNVDEPKEEYRLALLVWLVAMHFSELCPTRPLLLARGEAGSGKSMFLRILERFLFGPAGELVGIPDRQDGFTAMAASSHLMILDNLDEIAGWMRDKLARISTGSVDTYRKLYTSNEAGTVIYRVWVGITSRTPDILRRDDLVDRLLIFPMHRLEESQRRRESMFLRESKKRRNQFWGDLLKLLNDVVRVVNVGGIPNRSTMRLADFEALGRVIADLRGETATWDRFVSTWPELQRAFLVEESVIIEALDEWLKEPAHRGIWVSTRRLYNECQLALYGAEKPDMAWPKSVRSFGRQLQGIRQSLPPRIHADSQLSSTHMAYRFDVVP